jgi:hypothetical protein
VWLRWWNVDGSVLLWGQEQVEVKRQRAESERQRAEKLAEWLRSLGIDPDTVLRSLRGHPLPALDDNRLKTIS